MAAKAISRILTYGPASGASVEGENEMVEPDTSDDDEVPAEA